METILLFLIFRGLSSGLFVCSAFRMVSRVCLARSLSLLSREDMLLHFPVTLLSFDLCIWQFTSSPFSVPITAASELVHPAAQNPTSAIWGVSTRWDPSSPCSATSWPAPAFPPRQLPSSEKQDTHCRFQSSSSCSWRQEQLVDRCLYIPRPTVRGPKLTKLRCVMVFNADSAVEAGGV